MKIGFIGCGNMATAIIKGISRNASDKEIYFTDVKTSKMQAEEYGAVRMNTAHDIAENCDIVVLAVKPNMIESVLTENADIINKHSPLLISIAAGKTTDFIASFLNENIRVVRVMPNINAKVGEAVCGICSNANASENDLKLVEDIFNTVGMVLRISEAQFPLFSVLAGCSPAYVYMFIDALARAGVKNGMSKDVSLKIAAQAVLGSAKMIVESDEHPWSLIDQVCSPGGTTIEGLLSLQNDGFESAVHKAIDKAVDKDKKL